MPTERRLAAIMFTDIVGYTALMAESEEKGLRARERHRAVLGSIAAQHRGDVVDENGDELVLSFPSALDAVHCALAVQNDLDDAELQLRIGIHLGDVVFEDGRVYGDGVNIAARVRPLAEPGGVCVSHAVYELVRNQPQLRISPLGQRKLKNVPDRVGIYAVSDQLAAAPTPASVLAQPELRSIAVLPLENLGDAEHERVADGVTDALIESLARVGPELRVISRTSIMQYKGTRKTVGEIARELGVELLVEGTVLREDDQVLVRLQLIDAERDAHLWAQSYEREFGGVLRLGREIARTVTAEIDVALKPEREPLLAATTRPVDPEALDLYLRAVTLTGPSTLVVTWGPPVIALLERSVALDPVFAEGWAALAAAHINFGIAGMGAGSPDDFARAREAAQRAIELDERLGAAHAALGRVRLMHDWDFRGARSAFERAVELSPSDPHALTGLGQYLLFVGLGKSPESELLLERVLRVAPLDLPYRSERIVHLLFTREYEQGIAEVERVRAIDPEFVDANIPFLHFILGRSEDAVRELLAYFASLGAAADPAREAFQRGSQEEGFRGGLRAVTRLQIQAATLGASGMNYLLAMELATIGDTEEAMTWLERAYEEHEPLLINAKTEPRLDSLRPDPRFQDLIRRMGFPES